MFLPAKRPSAAMSKEKRLPFTGYKTAKGYHLDFTGCEKSRDNIGYHCLF